jgi:hypothetical protein
MFSDSWLSITQNCPAHRAKIVVLKRTLKPGHSAPAMPGTFCPIG